MEIRPVVDDAELELLIGIHNRAHPTTQKTFESALEEREFAPERCELLAWVDGEAVGAARGWITPYQRDRPAPTASLTVLPECRRRGVGAALYRSVSAWAAGRGLAELEVWVEDANPDGLDFFLHRGFVEVSRELRVALDLNGIDEPAVEPPPGIEIVTRAERPGLVNGMYEVALEAFPDIPGFEEDPVEPFEDWLAHELEGLGDRPESTFVALAGGEVVGYAKLHHSQARPSVLSHDITGVKRAWRGRGIARALKAAEIAWAKRAGYERLETGNELRNAPIRRLNEEFGYEPIPGRRLLRGPIAAGS